MSALGASPATTGLTRHRQNTKARSAHFMRTSSAEKPVANIAFVWPPLPPLKQEACQGYGCPVRAWSAQLLYRPLTTRKTQTAYDIAMTRPTSRSDRFRFDVRPVAAPARRSQTSFTRLQTNHRSQACLQ